MVSINIPSNLACFISLIILTLGLLSAKSTAIIFLFFTISFKFFRVLIFSLSKKKPTLIKSTSVFDKLVTFFFIVFISLTSPIVALVNWLEGIDFKKKLILFVGISPRAPCEGFLKSIISTPFFKTKLISSNDFILVKIFVL